MHRLRELMPLPADAADFALRYALGLVLLYACADKLAHPQDFAALVRAYHALPDLLVNPVAVWLPWLELLLGLCLVSGLWAEGAAVLAAVLLGSFWMLLVVSWARGIDVTCGCFSTRPSSATSEPAPMLFYVGRDAVLFGLALLTARVRIGVAGAAETAE